MQLSLRWKVYKIKKRKDKAKIATIFTFGNILS